MGREEMSADDAMDRSKMQLETNMDDQRTLLGKREWPLLPTLMPHLMSASKTISLAVCTLYPIWDAMLIHSLAKGVSHPFRHVELDIDIGADAKDWSAVQATEKLKPVETELRRIEEMVAEIVAEMEYLRTREQKLRDTNGLPLELWGCWLHWEPGRLFT
jgi:hypothetical protein